MIKRIERRYSKKQVLGQMLPLVREWFDSKFDELTDPQAYAVPIIHSRKNVLISSPTGSGKTLTAFLSIINELMIKQERGKLKDKIYCVYISPLKALANDIDKNLKQPLKELGELAVEKKMDTPKIRVAVRSGDTTSYERQKMARKPPHILITTPESLAIILSTPKFSQALHSAEWIIVDEIHEICSSKRGVMLSVNLERLQSRIEGKASRIGLSATQAPIEEMAKFLVGYDGRKQRDVNIVEVDTGKQVELKVVTPVNDMTVLPFEIINARMYDTLKSSIEQNTTTLVFTNTRSGTENVMVKLGELGLEDIAAHHGSLSRETRLDVEDRLKNGRLKAVVSSTSLELGIDIGSIDMMCQIGSPKSIAKGIQRVGRAGHGVGEVSRGKLIAFDNDDLVECAVLAKKASENYIDRVDLPRNSLDVLSQTLVGMSLEKRWDVDEAFFLIRNSYSFHTLPKKDFKAVLDYLSSRDMPYVYSKIWHDDQYNVFGRKKGSRLIYYLNSGTIPEEANYKVYSDSGGRLGELSESFAERLNPGDVFVLGGTAYEFYRSRGMSLFVKHATGKRPTVPSWSGEMLPRSFDLSVEIGRFRHLMKDKIEKEQNVMDWLIENYPIDEGGATTITSYIHEQLAFNGLVPTDNNLVIEGYLDPKRNLNLVFHYCFGRRTNDALARAYAMAVSNRYDCNVSVSVNDDCFMLTLSRRIGLSGVEKLVTTKNIIGLLDEALKDTELFKHRFRHCSTRGFMVLRNYRGRDIPVGKQYQRSQKVLRALGDNHDFPIIKETMNEIMNLNMNLEGAMTVLRGIESGAIKVEHASITDVPSPFAHNVVLVGMSDIVLMHDRSALLKELHRKVLLRVGGKDSLQPEFSMEKVREHFEVKRPLVQKKEDIAKLLVEAGPMELFTRKSRSIYDYSELDEKILAEWCVELTEEGEAVSVWTGRPLWAAKEELDKLSTIYGADKKPDKEGKAIIKVLEKKAPKSALAVSKALDMGAKETRRILGVLERAYSVSRGGLDKKGNTLWMPRKTQKRKGLKGFERRMLQRHLAYYAPLTAEELSFELGLPKEKMSELISDLESQGALLSGSFTEPSVQYMLAKDRSELKDRKGENIVSTAQVNAFRLRKYFEGMRTIDQYFDRYGVVWMPQDLMTRIGTKAYDKWLAKRRKGEILHGRFLDGSVCYVRTKDARTFVDAYRSEALDNRDKDILNIVKREPGIDLTSIVKQSGLPSSKVKPFVEKLDRNMHIVRQFVERESWSTWNRYESLEIRQRPKNKDKAAEKVIMQTLTAYSPISVRSLAYATGFSVRRVKSIADKALGNGKIVEVKTAEAHDKLLVSAEEVEPLKAISQLDDEEIRILTLYDPLVQPHRFELRRRFGDAWYYPIFQGSRPVGMMEMWEMSGCIDIREIVLDETELLPEFLDSLDRFAEYYEMNYMDIIRIKAAFGKEVKELDKEIRDAFKSKGYIVSRDWLLKGVLEDFSVSEAKFISYLLWKQHVTPSRRFEGMQGGLEGMGGFRSDDEATLRCKRTVPLKKLHKTQIVEYGRLFPLLLTYALPDHIALCKAARNVKPDKNMEILIQMFREEGPLKWREALDKSPLGYRSTLEAKSKLMEGLIILWDAKRQFHLSEGSQYNQAYARKEIIRSMFDQFGVFSAEQLAYYIRNEYRMTELRRIMQELEKEGFLVKGYLLDGSDRLHWMVKEDIKQIRKRPKKLDVVLTSMDRLAFYLVPTVVQKLKIGSSWLVISNGEIIGAASARGKRGEIRILKFEGSQKAWELLKDYCVSNGIRLKTETKDEAEDYQDWYERHLRAPS